MASILVLATDAIGRRMSGTGIRYWNLARVLASEHQVTLAAPSPVDISPPDGIKLCWFDGIADSRDELPAWQAGLLQSREHDIVVAQDIPYYHCDPETLQSAHLVIDLYAPAMLEKLEVARIRPERGEQEQADDVRSLNRLLTLGDYFICASERQRDFWLGALAAAGRLRADHARLDPELRTLIDCVPFGHPEQTPEKTGPGPRSAFPEIGENDRVLLWNGGLWTWLDPLEAIRAVAGLTDEMPDLRLVFMGTKSPSQIPGDLDIATEAKELADELGVLEQNVFFNDWVDFDDRHNWLLDADAVISLHVPSAEARFSYRTRLLDVLWSQTPVVASEGDVLAEMVDQMGIGVTAPPGDTFALQNAIRQVLNPAKNTTMRAAFADHAGEHTWEWAAEPLLSYCRQPDRVSSTRPVTPQDEYIHRLERHYTETAEYARHLERVLATQQAGIEASLSHRVSRTIRRLLPGVE